MSLNAQDLFATMTNAAAGVIKQQDWGKIKEYAEIEFKRLAEFYVLIEYKNSTGTVTPDEAKLYSDIARNNARSVMLTIEGIGLITAQQAINAAINAVKATINTAIGFALL